jgi:aspartyl-tRNA(Asn)/glutamyl-tRNA(Gln) amidotransferase subunit C
MELNEETIKNIAKVSRLNLDDNEIVNIKKEINEVLNAFEVIKECNTDDVKMSIQPVKVKDALRDDEEKECITQKEALSQTNHKKEGYFLGPKSV